MATYLKGYKNRIKILLFQFRNENDPVVLEERDAFANKAGVRDAQIQLYDCLQGPPSLSYVGSFDTLMIGGSGEYYVSKGNVPHIDPLLTLLSEVIEINQPTFASCFGFHLFIEALGGKIIHDPDNTEVGTYTVTLTEDGQKDELLGTMPSRFKAQLGRKDRAVMHPNGTLNLAKSLGCPSQSIRIPGKAVWATQFHPELSGTENYNRFLRYLKSYSIHMSPKERKEKLEGFQESPETEKLIPRFLDLVFG